MFPDSEINTHASVLNFGSYLWIIFHVQSIKNDERQKERAPKSK